MASRPACWRSLIMKLIQGGATVAPPPAVKHCVLHTSAGIVASARQQGQSYSVLDPEKFNTRRHHLPSRSTTR